MLSVSGMGEVGAWCCHCADLETVRKAQRVSLEECV